MKRAFRLLILVILFSPLQMAADIGTGHYSNGKFGFSFDYPAHLFVEETIPDAGDGIVLRSGDGMECRVFGSWLMESSRQTYRQQLQWEREAGSRVTYHVYRKGYYVISGFFGNGKRIFYQKTYIRGDYTVTIRFTYATGDKAFYDKQIVPIMEGLHFY